MADATAPNVSRFQSPLSTNIVRALRLAWAASPGSALRAITMTMMSALLAPLAIWISKQVVDLMVLGERGATIAAPVTAALALGACAAVQQALRTTQRHQQELYSFQVEHYATRLFLEHAAAVDLGHFDDPEWHDRLARARRDVAWRPMELAFGVISLAGGIVGVLALLGLLATLHPALLALSIASAIPVLAVQRRTNRRSYEWRFGTIAALRERDYLATLLSDSAIAKELRAYELGPHFLDRHHSIERQRYQSYGALLRRAVQSELAAAAGAGVVLSAAYVFAVMRGLSGAFTPGDVTALIVGFGAVTQQVTQIGAAVISLEQHAQFLDDYFSFLTTGRLVAVPAVATPIPERFESGISLQRVHFTYPGGHQEALSGVDFHVDPGELVAIVGDNGAGKSSIVNLLLRFYDPQAGLVSVGGVNLRDADPAALRRRLGVLVQDFARFQLSLRDNVRFGRVDRDANDQRVMTALTAAQIRHLAESMKNGLDSRLGRLFQGGRELSGGEWQRVALARVMFRQADIWVLDEPTSNLDPEAEAAIFTELKRQLCGRMGIVISHRFSTVRVADRIYVMQAGRITEVGSHVDLVSRGGRYAELFEMQASGYR